MDPNGLYEVWQESFFDDKPKLCMHGCSENEAAAMVVQLNDMIIVRRLNDFYDYKRIRGVKPKFEFSFPALHFYYRCVTDPMFVISKVSHTGMITYLETQYSYERATKRVTYYQQLFYRLNLLFVVHVDRETHPWSPRCYTGMTAIANKAASNVDCLRSMSYYEDIETDNMDDTANTANTANTDNSDTSSIISIPDHNELIQPSITFDAILTQLEEYIGDMRMEVVDDDPLDPEFVEIMELIQLRRIHRESPSAIIDSIDNVDTENMDALDLSSIDQKIIDELNSAFSEIDLFEWLLE